MGTNDEHTTGRHDESDRYPETGPLCDHEWLRTYQEHIHVCIRRTPHTQPHICECRVTQRVR